MFSLSKSSRVGIGVFGGILLLFTVFSPTDVFAEEGSSGGTDLTKPILALAAAIAIAGGLIGTGNAQQGIGAAGMGIIAEKPEKREKKIPKAVTKLMKKFPVDKVK